MHPHPKANYFMAPNAAQSERKGYKPRFLGPHPSLAPLTRWVAVTNVAADMNDGRGVGWSVHAYRRGSMYFYCFRP